jgi:hypothetical protein
LSYPHFSSATTIIDNPSGWNIHFQRKPSLSTHHMCVHVSVKTDRIHRVRIAQRCGLGRYEFIQSDSWPTCFYISFPEIELWTTKRSFKIMLTSQEKPCLLFTVVLGQAFEFCITQAIREINDESFHIVFLHVEMTKKSFPHGGHDASE